ncbi:hypothetical protein V4C53_44485 [Paraburkholderia azotifigens]|uniref:hypothetical protein n=1 Tax=Paraburkholderia azotifigens TaxID=2057004 RepID=UPI00316C368D
MKRSSIALFVSLLAVAGAASAQTASNGILMTHDRDVASKIEQHARDIQAQPVVAQQNVDVPVERVEQKPAHRDHRGHGHHHTANVHAARAHIESR